MPLLSSESASATAEERKLTISSLYLWQTSWNLLSFSGDPPFALGIPKRFRRCISSSLVLFVAASIVALS